MQLKSSRQKGVALVTALALMLVVAGAMVMMSTSTLGQLRHSRDNLAITQTLSLARGGANLAGYALHGEIKDDFSNLVKLYAATFATQNNWIFGGQGDKPDPVKVVDDIQIITTAFQARIDNAFCNANVAPADSGATVAIRMFVTDSACNNTVNLAQYKAELPSARFVEGSPRSGAGGGNVPQTYAIPYIMVAESTLGDYRRNIVLQGEYQFTIGRGSFAVYGLFTNIHRTAAGSSGSNVWFTNNTIFDGPVHTNQRFRFYKNPWFGGDVTSASCINPDTSGQYCLNNSFSKGAYYYGSGFRTASSIANNLLSLNRFGAHGPTLEADFDLGSDFIKLPPNSDKQRNAAQAAGLFINGDVDELKLWMGNAAGNEVSQNGGFQYIEVTQGGVTERYRFADDDRLMKFDTNTNQWIVEQDPFNGVVYSTGHIERLTGPARANANNPDSVNPAIADFAQMTVVSEGRTRITGDITYEDPPCSNGPQRNGSDVTAANCSNLGAQNVLGIYSSGDDVLIGGGGYDGSDSTKLAPKNVHVHAVLMSGQDAVRVERHNQLPDRGAVHLLGGMIENFYGAFGTFSAYSGSRTGYGRNLTYDRRMQQGLAPPVFPTTGDDEVKGVFVISYGQREQIY